MEKMPPIEKVYEAYSAIVDGRVDMQAHRAVIRSSSGEKTYTVQWEENAYKSNDSATYWQGYPGYLVIAVLMLQGRLPFDKEVAAFFANINWTALNAKHKRDYAAAVAEVMEELRESGVDTGGVKEAVDEVYEAMGYLGISVGRGSAKD